MMGGQNSKNYFEKKYPGKVAVKVEKSRKPGFSTAYMLTKDVYDKYGEKYVEDSVGLRLVVCNLKTGEVFMPSWDESFDY